MIDLAALDTKVKLLGSRCDNRATGFVKHYGVKQPAGGTPPWAKW
jgi:hypothetical protein